jgi:hypothetical protein
MPVSCLQASRHVRSLTIQKRRRAYAAGTSEHSRHVLAHAVNLYWLPIFLRRTVAIGTRAFIENVTGRTTGIIL